MFVKAIEHATHFTPPLIGSSRDMKGNVVAGISAFVVINSDCWIVTAGHDLGALAKFNADSAAVEEYDHAVAEIQANDSDPNRVRNKIRKIPKDDTWLRNVSIWWGQDGVAIDVAHVYPDIDIAVARLTGYDATGIQDFPEFFDSGAMKPGTSLCKLGYPFHDVGSSWDDATKGFQLAPGALPAPLFPIEGIMTRFADGGVSKDGFPFRLIETSSPGLRGQSGGPVFDREGSVWGIQVHTVHLPLGFNPTLVQSTDKTVEEHQFLNVGRAVSTVTLRAVFDRHGIDARWRQ